jgi:hypothetical protein
MGLNRQTVPSVTLAQQHLASRVACVCGGGGVWGGGVNNGATESSISVIGLCNMNCGETGVLPFSFCATVEACHAYLQRLKFGHSSSRPYERQLLVAVGNEVVVMAATFTQN